jgi:hypothetical protein
MNDELIRAERRRKWREEEAARVEASKDRAAESTGIPRDHPKFEVAWRIAWDLGHSSGFHEVENYFDDLSELLR